MIYKIDTKNPDGKFADEIVLITEEDSWDDIAKTFINYYGASEMAEFISILIGNDPKILDEILSWPFVQEKIKEPKK